MTRGTRFCTYFLVKLLQFLEIRHKLSSFTCFDILSLLAAWWASDDHYLNATINDMVKFLWKMPNNRIIWLLLLSEHTHQVMSTFRLGLPDQKVTLLWWIISGKTVPKCFEINKYQEFCVTFWTKFWFTWEPIAMVRNTFHSHQYLEREVIFWKSVPKKTYWWVH